MDTEEIEMADEKRYQTVTGMLWKFECLLFCCLIFGKQRANPVMSHRKRKRTQFPKNVFALVISNPWWWISYDFFCYSFLTNFTSIVNILAPKCLFWLRNIWFHSHLNILIHVRCRSALNAENFNFFFFKVLSAHFHLFFTFENLTI